MKIRSYIRAVATIHQSTGTRTNPAVQPTSPVEVNVQPSQESTMSSLKPGVAAANTRRTQEA